MHTRAIVVAALAGLATTPFVLAQAGTGGTITNNNATFTQGAYLGGPTGTGPTSDFTVGGPGNPDHLFQAWWWTRAAGETRESALSGATSATFGGALGAGVAQIDYNFPTYFARMRYSVSGLADGRGVLTQTLTVLNLSPTAQTIDIFNYNDIDLAGTSGGDAAVLNNPGGGDNVIRVTDGPWTANYEGTQVYRAGAFSSVRDLLTNNVIDNFNSSGLPFAAGDFTGGFQWRFQLEPGSAATASATLTIGLVPAPGAAALGGLGLLLAARRRRA